MVSMKPGSGTIGLDPDFDDYSGSPADVERRRQRRSETIRRAAEAKDADRTAVPYPSPEMPGTRYGGPPPGTHGPWRWGQLVKGSALERVSLVCGSPRRTGGCLAACFPPCVFCLLSAPESHTPRANQSFWDVSLALLSGLKAISVFIAISA